MHSQAFAVPRFIFYCDLGFSIVALLAEFNSLLLYFPVLYFPGAIVSEFPGVMRSAVVC